MVYKIEHNSRLGDTLLTVHQFNALKEICIDGYKYISKKDCHNQYLVGFWNIKLK